MRANTICALLLAGVVSQVIAAPLPQLAGEGAACNSILSQTDNGVGYGVENAEDNTAATIKSTGAKRQLAGEGAACDSILSQTDNGAGYGVENAEDNTAKTISSSGAKLARQLDKIANGAGEVGDAAVVGGTTAPVVQEADTIDGQTTSDGATLGQQVGDDEATTLENAGSAVPKH